MRLLIADRDQIFSEVLQSFLWDQGHEVEITASGVECVTTLREFVPDLLVLDEALLWGGTDGVLNFMQDEPDFTRTPVILTTGGEIPEKLMASANLPIACLTKPYRLKDLLSSIDSANSFLRSQSAGRQQQLNPLRPMDV